MQTPKELGAEIARLRHEQKLTQKALAERLHVTDKAVSRWERGLGYPDFQLLDGLCQALELPVEQLLFGKTQAVQQAPRNETETAPEAAEVGQHESLASVYADAEKAYRARLCRRRLVAAGMLGLLLVAFLMYRAIFQPRVRQTLTGSYTPPNGAPVSVQVELDGRLYSFLLRDRLYYGGTVTIRSEDGAALFSRRFVAKDHAEGMDAIGLLHVFEDAFHCSAFVYCPEQNKFGSLDCWLSKDCTKLWIARNDALPGELLAAAGPDVDMERFRERCLIHTASGGSAR